MKKFFLFIFLLVGCSKNILKETGKTNTTEAKYYQAKLEMNSGNYDSAIIILNSLDPLFLAQRDVALVYASSYSGRCGLNFINLIQKLKNSPASGTIFLYLMSLFPSGSDNKISDCVKSEGTLNSLGIYSARYTDENILMGLSSLTKVGTILNRNADTNNDGVSDVGFNHCSISDDHIREIGTGIANAILSFSQVTTAVSSATLGDITALCALDPSLNVFCTTTDKAVYSPTEVSLLRAIIGSTDQGIGACPGSFLTCICP